MPDKRIRVEFIDATTQKTFAITESPPEMLPDSFEASTTLHIGEEEWQVLKAEPLTRKDYVRQGKLVLTLAKIMMMPVKDILYSLPTIYAELPPLHHQDQPIPEDSTFFMEADLWRAIEFVPLSDRDEIDKEFVGIADIYAHHREGHGFNKIYLRSKPIAPLAGRLRLTELRALFTGAQPFAQVAFQREAGTAPHVFALQYGVWVLYGETQGEIVQSLALHPVHGETARSVDPFLNLIRVYNLVLVDWLNASAMTELEAEMFLNTFQTR